MSYLRETALAVALVGSVALPASATPLGSMVGPFGSATPDRFVPVQMQADTGRTAVPTAPTARPAAPAARPAVPPGRSAAPAVRPVAPGGPAVVQRGGPGAPLPLRPRHGDGWGNAAGTAAAGIAGGIIGGIIASQNPGPVYAPPPPAPAYGAADPDWIAYCARRYHTFDPHTGTYLAADGLRYMCE